MKNIFQVAILACISSVSIHAIADDSTVSLGYAQTALKGYKNLKGLNAQYRYENQSPWGAVVSSTYTSGKLKDNQSKDKGYLGANSKINYFSVLAGPSYRVNDYVSFYALAGLSRVKAPSLLKNQILDDNQGNSDKSKKTNFAYGAGVSINPVENIAINIGYEGSSSKFDNKRTNFNGFNIGVGYKF